MKIKDLLIKISNGEIPKKIKYKNIIYEYVVQPNGTGYLQEDTYNTWFSNEHYFDDVTFLNDEVEIIEDENEDKIQKIEVDSMNRIKATSTGSFVYSISQPMKIIIKKLNEVIDKINEMNKDV